MMLNANTVATTQRYQMVEITQAVKDAVAQSGVKEGLCVVYTTDIDAGVMVTSFYDPKGHEDIMDDLVRIFPARDNFQFSGPVGEGAARCQSAVNGTSRDFIVSGGEVQLGGSEGIYYAEFCGPKTRQYKVKVIGR